MWQLAGFYLATGGKGKVVIRGWRSEIHWANFADSEKVVYRIHMKRVINRKLVMGMADGEVEGRWSCYLYCDRFKKVGLFQDTSAF